MTLSEISGIKYVDFSVFTGSEEARSSLLKALNKRGFKSEHLINKVYVADNQVNIAFLRIIGVVKKHPAALDNVTEKCSSSALKGRTVAIAAAGR